ncbi:MAG: hypothetical protein ILA34_00240 [Bacteroidaceae bacterium]|nr:hypothetical protein [Bacteroidaceae bacterium]
MKRIAISMVFCLSVVLCSFAQKEVDKYYNNYWDKEFKILATELKTAHDTDYELYIGVMGESSSKDVYLSLKSSKIPDLIAFLQNVRSKYEEWCKVAQENNVKDLRKEMDFVSPGMTVSWYGTKWWFSFYQEFRPSFMILDNGKMVVSMYKKVVSSSNKYIDQKVYFVFDRANDIDGLIKKIQPEVILEKLRAENKTGDLFH